MKPKYESLQAMTTVKLIISLDDTGIEETTHLKKLEASYATASQQIKTRDYLINYIIFTISKWIIWWTNNIYKKYTIFIASVFRSNYLCLPMT